MTDWVPPATPFGRCGDDSRGIKNKKRRLVKGTCGVVAIPNDHPLNGQMIGMSVQATTQQMILSGMPTRGKSVNL